MSRKRRSPNASTAAPTTVRLLWALASCERLTALAGAAHAGWALGQAAKNHGVDCLVLAELWITKVIACQSARAHAAAMNDADDTERGKP